MPREKDIFWQYFDTLQGTTNKVTCKFCGISLTATIARLKYHLAGLAGNDVRRCLAVPDEICEQTKKAICEVEAKNKRLRTSDLGKSSSASSQSQSSVAHSMTTFHGLHTQGAQPKIQSFIKKKEKKIADLKIMGMIVSNNLAFNLLRSEEFKEAMTAVANHGPGYIPPSYETGRTKLLVTLKEQATEYVNVIKESWVVSGCTLMSDSWTDARKRPHINLLASSPKGIIFLNLECNVGKKKKDAAYIADFVCRSIEEIGPSNVVRFISDNASNYVAAGHIIEAKFPHIFKTSCVAHCIDLMLEQIDELPEVGPILANARTITKFMYKFQHVLDLLRSHTKGKELKRPGSTRFATQFLCLQSVAREEQALRNMMASSQWRILPQSKTEDGIGITAIIQGNSFWKSANEILMAVEPLVRLLRMTDSDGSTMCYLYEGMDRAKKGIKKAFNNDASKFMPYWEIIDKRWNETLDNPLHAFSAYLNPYLFYHKLVKMHIEVKNAIEKVKAKLVPEVDKKAFAQDLRRYHSRDTHIFVESAIDVLDNVAPRIWWDMYGIEIPILQKVVIKLCSQTCSDSGCERNWSAFDVAHTKKRNKLEPKKLHDLVYVRMNMHFMKTSVIKEAKDSEPILLDKISAFPEDLDEVSDDEFSSSSNSEAGSSGSVGNLDDIPLDFD